jgi:RND family efflux transporter MFP subunit
MQINNRKAKRPMINIVVRAGVSILVLAAGVAAMVALAGMKSPPVEKIPPERALQVTAFEVAPEDVAVSITGYGEVKSLNVVTLSPEVAGRVVAVHPRLEPGEVIPAGELLYKIDPRDYAAAATQARAAVNQLRQSIRLLEKQLAIDTRRLKTLERNRDLSRDEFRRLKTLYETDKVGTRSGVEAAEQRYNNAADQAAIMARALALYPIQLSEAKSSLAAARSRQEVAETNLARCEVRAPFKARIKAADIEANQYVSPGIPVLTLADDQTLEIQVPLDSRDAKQWLIFQASDSAPDSAWFGSLAPVDCTIRWTEDPGGPGWQGRLHRVVKFDQETRTVTVAVRIDAAEANPRGGGGLPLVEGMFCSVEIPGRELRGVFRLPRWAVSFENTVFLSDNGRLKTVPVTVARIEGEAAFVSEGLESGDKVITTRLIDPLENVLLKVTLPKTEASRS